MAPSHASLSTILKLLGNSRWSLNRTLRSTNVNEINGQLSGTATFTQLPANTNADQSQDWLYTESGQFPASALPPALAGMANATWSKKYIWRLSDATSQLSAWFVKVGSGPDEADYLFHNFDFTEDGRISLEGGEEHFPPVPALPANTADEQTYVLRARGDHLCINDMYRTSYAFRFLRDTEELVSWSSLHVVRGPAKTQEIRNQYALQ
ncbi:hypothetical protein N7466_008368 [Penicillium verhagenii]|uniref:uncharacterized protein n=1 Tax=Penicillium verhagenii TaxID=1562060 RepID=UPI002545393D|nr:uncharacterized protein N7466_008368 [Penicillium verhagenii]KAJ5924181.1 hypothetical protein N7466_008368 [Penicillium verhagenii]